MHVAASAAFTPANAPLVCDVTRSAVAPASRSSSVSPTHTIGVIAVLHDRLELQVDGLVGLAEELAALRVPDDHVLHVELREHRRAHLAGERTLVLPVAVLRAEPDLQPVGLDERLQRAQVGERRAHDDVARLRSRPRSSRYDSFCTTWIATKWSWCIFQLPAMIGLRSAAITTGRFRYGSLFGSPCIPGRAGRPAR